MSKTSGQRRGLKLKPINKQTALEILESAIAYCQQSGFVVSAGNVAGNDEGTTLLLRIPGARLDKTGPTPRFLASNSAHAGAGAEPAPADGQEVASNDAAR